MASHDTLLTYAENMLGCLVPAEVRGWLGGQVCPEVALDNAELLQLLWLSLLVDPSAEERDAHAREQLAACCACEAARQSPPPPGTKNWVMAATGRLRSWLWCSGAWSSWVDQWEHHQTRGLGTVRYPVHAGLETTTTWGTAIGAFAVRELRWADAGFDVAPALRHLERTPSSWKERQGPEYVFGVDHVYSGRSVGTFASAAVAFEIAQRLDRAGITKGPISARMQRALDTFRGDPPPVHVRSWPARPPLHMVQRVVATQVPQPRPEVRHARR